MRDEPTLLSGLVRVAVLAIVVARVGGGLEERGWAAPELEKIQRDLGAVRLWDDYRLAISSERGFYNTILSPLVEGSPRERSKLMAGYFAPNAPINAGARMFGFLPRRVFRDNQLRHNQLFDEMLARVDPSGDRFNLEAPLVFSPEHLSGFEQFYFFLFRVAGPGYAEIEKRYVHLDTQLDQMRIACALERFRLVRGAYPSALQELVPEFLEAVPEDPYARAPLKYARTEEGSFRLYSVGKNRIDDGGVLNPKKTERQQLDAIWLCAPKGATLPAE